MKKLPKRAFLALLLCFSILLTPVIFAGCESVENGKDGKDGKDGAEWFRGGSDVDSFTEGKTGDFYIDTENYKLYQKNSDGGWSLVIDGFGRPGTDGRDGDTVRSYTYVRYAKDANGTDASEDPTGRSYISVLTTEKEAPEPSDFKVWIKFVGGDGKDGNDGAPGKDGVPGKDGAAYVYIAFASDGNGTGFSKTHTKGLDYIGIITSDTEIKALTKEHFAGKWIKFVGSDGKDGEDGLTPYIGYDGYWWTGKDRGEQRFFDVLSGNTVESTAGLAGNGYFEKYVLDMGQSRAALMNGYYASLNKTLYSGLTLEKITVYAETAGTLTVSTASVSEAVSENAGANIPLDTVKMFTLVKEFNTLELGGYLIPDGSTVVLGGEGDTARLIAYRGIAQNDGQGVFSDLSESGLYKQTDGVNDKLVIGVEKSAEKEAIKGLQSVIDTIGTQGSGRKAVKLSGTYTHANITAYAGKTVSRIDVRASSHTAESADNVFTTVRVVKQADASLVSTHKFYADPKDITGTALNKTLTLTCKDEICVGEDEALVFANNGDTLLWSYVTNLTDVPITGGFNSGINIGTSIGSPNVNALLAVNVYVKDTETVSDIMKRLEREAAMEKAILDLKSVIGEKKISIIGDSISTYSGVSNSGSPNQTTSGNKIYFGAGGSNTSLELTDTWWKQAIDACEMELLVNNSYSGSWVTDTRANASGCGSRAENLDSDSGVKPDIIAAYIGVNDLGSGSRPCNQVFDSAFFTRVEGGAYTSPHTSGDYIIPTYFDEGYALMIYKIKRDNPDADIFCFTIPETEKKQSALLAKYNNAIRNIAEHYGCSVVELHGTDSESYTELSLNYQKYTSDGLHPNKEGMDIITRKFLETLAGKYGA